MSITGNIKRSLSAAFLSFAINQTAVGETPPSPQVDPIRDTSEVCVKGDIPYLAFNMRDGRIIDSLRDTQYIQPASINKLLFGVAYIKAVEDGLIAPYDRLKISNDTSRKASEDGGRNCHLRNKSRLYPYLTYDLGIQLAAVHSCNDAAIAIAKDIVDRKGGDIPNALQEDAFANYVNNTIIPEIGMDDTRIANASGLPNQKNHTTLRDLAKLLRYIDDNYPELKEIFAEEKFDVGGYHKLTTNTLIRDEDFPYQVWGKTGSLNDDDFGKGIALSAKNERGTHIGLITLCHKEAFSKTQPSRHSFAVAKIEEATETVENYPTELHDSVVIDWNRPPALPETETCPDPWGNPISCEFLGIARGEGDFKPHPTERDQQPALADSAHPARSRPADTEPQHQLP